MSDIETQDQQVVDDSDLRKYRTELPNLYDDADLDPYEFRLLAHYKRVGTCWESVRTTAEKCHMSIGQVSEKRQSLAEKGFITVTDRDETSSIVTVVDVWAENFAVYSEIGKRSSGEQPVHVVNQRSNHTKKGSTSSSNTGSTGAKRPRDPNLDNPAVVAYRDTLYRTPNEMQRSEIAKAVTNLEIWQSILNAWRMNNWNPGSAGKMLEAYREGGIKSNRDNNGTHQRVSQNPARPEPEFTAADRAVAERINARARERQLQGV